MAAGRGTAARNVGRYQLVHELGQSYLGPLWAVRVEGAEGTSQLAMLRLVSLARLDADTRVRLLEAAWQAMEVRDDRICSVTDVVASDGELGIVSDYVEGVTLRGLSSFASVRRKPAPPAVALRIALDLLTAIGTLHRTTAELGEEAVPLFGGLSADSVLLGSDGRTLVLDVAVTSAASTIETLGGSPERVAYAAPEQLGSPPRADARTDVFTAGVLLWELLACRRLFVGADKAVGQKVLSSKIPRPDELRRKGDPEIPGALVAAVMKALDRAPDARPESAEAFAALLNDSGVVPADHSEVARYVTALAESALQRAREAVRHPRAAMPRVAVKAAEPSPPAARAPLPARTPASPVRPEMKPASPARPEMKPASPARPEMKPASPVRPEAKPALPARPDVKAMMMMPARTDAKPAFPVRTDVKPQIRPRQATMIGIPAPAQPPPEPAAPPPAPPEPTPPPPAPAESAPPSDTSDEEPTVQFTSRDLLRQVEEMDRRSEPAKGPPTDVPTPEPNPSSADFPEPKTFPKPPLVSSPSPSPSPSAPVDGGWLDDPASLPPPPPVDREAPTPDDPQETALAAEPRRDHPIPPRVVPSGPESPPSEAPTARAPDRPLMSRPPAALSIPPASMSQSPAYLPSQVPPPLIHDPRARGAAARRGTAGAGSAAAQASNGLGIGIALSIGLIMVSAAVAILFLRSQREEESESPAAGPAATVTATLEPVAAPAAESAGSAPAVAPSPSSTDAVAGPGTAPSDGGTAAGSVPVQEATREPGRRPTRAAPRPPTKRAKKKKARYVPEDI